MVNVAAIVDGIVTIAIPAILAITLHEAAHGFVALLFGDPTAAERHRLSLNPLRHIDPIGTIVLPVLLYAAGAPVFGWAKPVPVDFSRLRNPRRDMVWVAAAGPGMNLILATLSALLLHLVPLAPAATARTLVEILQNSMLINTLLAVFNMLPIPPLDGGRVAVGILPLPLARRLARLEKYGILILLLLILGLPWLGETIGRNLNLFAAILLPIVDHIIRAILALTGLS